MIPVAARRKAMMAAASTPTSSVREAAIVGGIVRCAIASGMYDPDRIAGYVPEILDHFKLANVDRRRPGAAEITMVVARFEREYGRPFS